MIETQTPSLMDEWTYEGSGIFRHTCGLAHVEPTLLGMVTFRRGPWCDNHDDIEERAPWIARLAARDETGLAYC